MLAPRNGAKAANWCRLLGALGVLAQRSHHALQPRLAMLGACPAKWKSANLFQESSRLSPHIPELHKGRPKISNMIVIIIIYL